MDYVTHSNRRELDGQTGTFICVAPSAKNHGPVSVRNTYDFGYADGTPYFPFGTTCYAWTHQPAALQQQTIETLRNAPFNKMRMCIFPKWYTYNQDEPLCLSIPPLGRARTTTPASSRSSSTIWNAHRRNCSRSASKPT